MLDSVDIIAMKLNFGEMFALDEMVNSNVGYPGFQYAALLMLRVTVWGFEVKTWSSNNIQWKITERYYLNMPKCEINGVNNRGTVYSQDNYIHVHLPAM